MTKPLQSLLQKEISRKEFIATLGFGIASLIGISNVVQSLTGRSMAPSFMQSKQQSSGYGSSPYGGTNSGA
jgi:hypothetical protein